MSAKSNAPTKSMPKTRILKGPNAPRVTGNVRG